MEPPSSLSLKKSKSSLTEGGSKRDKKHKKKDKKKSKRNDKEPQSAAPKLTNQEMEVPDLHDDDNEEQKTVEKVGQQI